MVAAATESGQSTAAHAYVAGRETGCSRSRARVSGMPPGQAKTSPKTIAGRENSIGTKPVEKLGSKPNRITDRTTTPIGSHSESFSVRIMRIELLALANPSNQPLDVGVRLFGGEIATDVFNVDVYIPANSAKAFLLDELGTIPEDHVGLARIFRKKSIVDMLNC